MAAQIKSQQSDDSSDQVNSVPISDKKEQISIRGGKELEGSVSEEKLLKEVVERSHEADLDAEKKVQESISEARLSKGDINLPADVADSGVKSREKEASEIVQRGSDLVLPMNEEDYKSQEIVKIEGRTDRDQDVTGVLSVAGLVALIGRVIKAAHKHAKKVVFRNKESNTEGEE